MRKKLFAALLAAVLLLLCGCQGKPIPEGMEEGEVIKSGVQIVRLLVSGDYEEVHALLRQDQREACTPEDVQALALSELEGAGVYKEVEDTMVTGQSAEGEDFAVVALYCKFSEENVLIRLSFDQNMELIGLSLHQQ